MSASSSREISVGVVLGETYEIVRLLGEGGMGSVWEASHLRLPGKRCAVKVLHAQASLDPESFARFRREAEIASRLGHPNIVDVDDWNTLASGTPYLVLEYLQGEDLASRIATGALPIDQALSIARQIGSALKAAHQAEVVHRDLKPGNVFLVPREVAGEIVDHVKVLDFGISKIRNSSTVQTQEAVLLGTPQYMAPEQALGKNHEIDARTDQFALASIVYEMIAGKPTFEGSSLAEVVFKVVYEPVVPLSQLVPGLDPSISAAVERAMSKAPDDRFPDVSSFIAALTGRSLATSDRRAVSNPDSHGFIPPTAGRTAMDPLTRAVDASRPPSTSTGSSNRWAFMGAAIVVGAVATFGIVSVMDKKPKSVIVDTPAAKPPVVPEKRVEKPPVVQEKPVEKVPEKVEPDTKKVVHDPKPQPAAIESPELKAELDAGEASLKSGDRDAAQLSADRALRIQKSSRGYALLTRVHCAKEDLGNAKATYPHVASGDRPRVRKECKAHGIDLD